MKMLARLFKNLRKSELGRKVIKTVSLLVFVLFIAWTLQAGIFMSKIAAPTVDLVVKRGESAYYQYEVKSPYVYDERDEAYAKYAEAEAKFSESNDKAVIHYGQSNALVKILAWIWAIAPYSMLIFIAYEFADGLSAKPKTIKRHA